MIAVPAAVFGATLALLSLLHTPYASWLQVEAPAYAVAGSTLDVRITLGQVPEPTLLVVYPYLLGKNHKAIIGYPSLTPSPSVQSGGTYSFRIEVKEAEKVALLELVIYLSPTGMWRARSDTARSEAIPVRTRRSPVASAALRKTQTFAESSRDSDARVRPVGEASTPASRASRMLLSALLTAGCLVCAIRWARRSAAGPGRTRERMFWRGASIVLLLGSLWEVLRLEERLAEWGRDVVSRLDIYYLHQSFQKVAVALLAAGLAAVLVASVRAVTRNRALLVAVVTGVALACYTGLSLAGALSFHYIDALKRALLNGVSVLDMAKAVCAAAVLALALFSPWPRKRQAH